MKTRETELRAEVDRWLEAAEAADAQEDKLHGASRRGDEMPGWIADKQKRLAKIREARQALEAEAAAAAAAKAEAERAAEEKRKAENRKRSGPVPRPPSKEPDPKAQRNFTDPDSRVLLTKDGFIRGYNAQAAVDGAKQIIVAHGLTQSMSDCPQLVPLVDAVRANLGRKPREISADAGYCSEGNLLALATRRDPRLCRYRASQASGRDHAQGRRRDDADNAAEAEARRLSQPVPIAKADRGAGVRADQASARISTIPAARP